MKTLFTSFILLVVASSFVDFPTTTAPETEVYYDVQLVSNNPGSGGYEWVWSVTNPAPGNGKDGTGTLQDLSHWSLAVTECMLQEDIVSAAYSSDGMMWHPMSVNISVDASQTCYSNPVLKFDVGTIGGNVMYYKLVVNQQFTAGFVPAVFKSGKNTGCYVASVEGMSCDGDDGSSR